jgi:hypothetical protein
LENGAAACRAVFQTDNISARNRCAGQCVALRVPRQRHFVRIAR